MGTDFAHLHLHTQYSFLDGAIHMADLAPRIKELGMTSCAVTEHGNLFGAIDFYKRAKEVGIKPILGCEAYVAENDRTDKTNRKSHHLVLLAKDKEGWGNLKYLVSMGYVEGFYYKPRIDKKVLRERSKGLIGLTACLGGEVANNCYKGDVDAARRAVRDYKSIFEPGHFFIELQQNGLEEQKIANERMKQLSRDESVPLIATNDCHYKLKQDAAAHDVLMCIQQGRARNDPSRPRHNTDAFYIRSGDEMQELFSDCPEAFENTLRVRDMIDLKLDLGKPMLPTFVPPDGSDLETHLRDRAKQGLERRFREMPYKFDRDFYYARLSEELDIIVRMKFPGYFLIVADFINWAKEHQIPVGPGRGSGAGSLVAYALRITDLDPLPYNLLFERFLNPERVSMPDFDVDFCQERRGEVIKYVSEKYGSTNVGQIATFAQLKAKSVIKDVARVLEVPFQDVNTITKLLPNTYKNDKGDVKPITIDKALELEPKLKELQDENQTYGEIIEIARKLEGLFRQAGMHAAGVVIADVPLWDVVPVFRGKDDELVAQFSMSDVEQAGLVKFDFLGLKTLDVIEAAEVHVNRRILREIEKRDAAKLWAHPHIARRFGNKPALEVALDAGKLVAATHALATPPCREDEDKVDVTLRSSQLALDDQKVYRLIGSGATVGVFQLESTGFQELLKRLKPDCFEDIIAAVALYRPGPLQTGMVDDFIDCKHGKKQIRYPHPLLEGVLKPTYGGFVYQEQVMQAAQVMGGYSLGGADLLRRAMGKKKADAMAAERAKFVAGCTKSGITEKSAGEVFDLMEKFAGYGFNKCLAGSTRIVDAETGERTTIESLFRSKRRFNVHALGEQGKLRARRVTDVVWNGRKPVFRLKTAQGHEIVATANHPFRTLDGWTNLEHLAVGSRIAAPRRLPIAARASWARHELIALAGLLSEGNTCHPSCLYFFNNRRELIDDFAHAAACFPDSVARIHTRADGAMEVSVSTGRDTRFRAGQRPWNARGRCDGNTALAEPDVLPARSGLFRWAGELGILGVVARDKRIPDPIFALRDEDLELFLGRLWAGDGFIANRTNFVPFYATSSRELAEGVQLLLLRLGIPSGVHEKAFKYRGGERPGFTVHVLGAGAIDAFLARIGPHCLGREEQVGALRAVRATCHPERASIDTIPPEVRRWIDEERRSAGLTWTQLEERSGVSTREMVGRGSRGKRGFQRSTIAKLAAFFESERLRAISDSDLLWDRVVSIEPAGIEDTYDLTVEDDHNFVAEGLVVHNSHSAAYALVTFQTAYFKTYYPVEFMAALLSTELTNTENIVKYIAEAKSMGIAVLPPTVNDSETSFTVPDQKIRFGLGAIKGLGEGALEAILSVRKTGGPFKSLYDLCERVSLKHLNKKTLESLVCSGALDSFGRPRAQLMAALDHATEAAKSTQRDKETGQVSLFSLPGLAASMAKPREVYDEKLSEWPELERLKREKEAIGFYVTAHPLDRYASDLKRYANATIGSLEDRDRQEVVLGCSVTTLRERPLKDGSGRLAFALVEDLTGAIEMMVPSRVFAENEALLKSDQPLLIKAAISIDHEGETSTLRARAVDVRSLAETRAEVAQKVELVIDESQVESGRLGRLREVFKDHPGRCRVAVRVRIPKLAEVELELPEGTRLAASEAVVDRVEALFGRGTVRFV